jgi:hypothetical protein
MKQSTLPQALEWLWQGYNPLAKTTGGADAGK